MVDLVFNRNRQTCRGLVHLNIQDWPAFIARASELLRGSWRRDLWADLENASFLSNGSHHCVPLITSCHVVFPCEMTQRNTWWPGITVMNCILNRGPFWKASAVAKQVVYLSVGVLDTAFHKYLMIRLCANLHGLCANFDFY